MTIFPSITFSLKRLWAYRSLVACLIIGLIAATTLSVAVPLYADAANYNLLRATLSKAATESRRPPFSFIFHYVGSWHEPITPEQYTPVDQFMQGQIAGIVGLPASGVTRYIATDNLQLYPNGEEIVRSQRLDLVKLAFVSGLFNGEGSPHIRLVEGKLPQPVVQSGAPLEALVSLKLANDLGLKVGDAYLLYEPAQAGASPFRLPVRVAGIWLPVDPAEGFWFYPPESFEKRFLIPEETFWGAVAQNLPQPINEAVWRLSFDGRDVYSEDVPGLLERVAQAQTRLNALLPHTDLESSPVQALRQYRRESLALTGLLFVFSAPVLGLAFYFLGLVAATLVRRQRNEIAVLRSRGASRLWVTAIYGVEWSLLGVIALLIGSWLAMETARLVGQTQSFLDFSRRVAVPVRLSKEALGLGLLAAGAALLFSLFPAWQAGRDTIVSYKQERARARRTPLWQRAYLDMFLLLPALYGLYTFRAQGRLVLLGRAVGSSNPFENPLIFLLPTLFMVALSLLVLRLLPWLLKGLAWVAAQMPGTAPVLALRRLARSAGDHLPPLMLMMVTLSLAGFVASMAHTLDRSLYDGVYYEVGADLNLVEGGEYTGESAADLAGISSMNSMGGSSLSTGIQGNAVWNFLPVSDHLALPGVQAAARVGRYDAQLEAGSGSASGRLIGLDRTDFPGVAFFREDFANEPLVALMNRLASDPAALLVDRATWERFHLNTGDQVAMRVNTGEAHTIPFKVAGVLSYFPTLYPEDGPFFVANLEYLFESTGGLQPYDVWLRTAPGTDTQAVIRGINAMGVAVVRAQDARSSLEEIYAAPNRQGMLGMLSVGFLAASALTVIGFLLFNLFSFRERFIQLGVLRAIGLSAWQMGASLALEQVFLLLAGLAAGTGIAILTSFLFIPHLPAAIGSHPGTPPYTVEIAWVDIIRVYVIFCAMLLIGVSVTTWALSRMKVFQAIKLGETT